MAMRRSSAGWVILVGVCLSVLGVVFNFQLERHSYTMQSVDSEFELLERAFIPCLLLGLLTTLVGSVVWAFGARLRILAAFGLVGTASALLAAKLTPVNVHGWTESLMFLYATALLISALFLLLASVRFALSKGILNSISRQQ